MMPAKDRNYFLLMAFLGREQIFETKFTSRGNMENKRSHFISQASRNNVGIVVIFQYGFKKS